MSGLMIIALIIVAIIVYHFVPEKVEEPEKPHPKPRHVFASTTDDAWRTRFHENSESPAEVAFINAMIDAFGLTPKLGALFSETLRLDLQVEQGQYRADFMVNHWLIIEIDGAAWHSSYEAKARDAMRDVYFESLGYTVLRIPAKTALYQSAEAIRCVEAALAVGKRQLPEPAAPVPLTGFQRLARTGSLMAQSVSDIAEAQRQRLKVGEVLGPAEAAFDLEKKIIGSAIFRARQTKAERDAGGRLHIDPMTHQLLEVQRRANSFEPPINFYNQAPLFPDRLLPSGAFTSDMEERFSNLADRRRRHFERVKNNLREDDGILEITADILRDTKNESLLGLIT